MTPNEKLIRLVLRLSVMLPVVSPVGDFNIYEVDLDMLPNPNSYLTSITKFDMRVPNPKTIQVVKGFISS